ncbi:MAG: type 2 lanthipeptide synthetase LanM [Halobacteria archaeon]
MNFTEEQRRSIPARAEFLFERIEDSHYGEDTGSEDVGNLIQHWKELLGDISSGDKTLYHESQKLAGVDEETVKKAAAFGKWPENEDYPEWLVLLEEFLENIRYIPVGWNDGSGDVDPIPYEDVLYPFAEYAYNEYIDKDLINSEIAGDEAAESLKRRLVSRLSKMVSQPLHVEFQVFLADHTPEVFSGDRDPGDSTELYQKFTEYILEERFPKFLEIYPVAARYIGTGIDQWIEATNEFLGRIKNDYDEVAEKLTKNKDPGAIVYIEADGDSHLYGRVVFILEFESGDRIVYKPKNLDVEGHVYRIMDYFDDGEEFKTPETLLRENYGWVEYIENKDTTEPEDYYRRLGELLSIIYIVHGTDFHFENIIASGNYPVPVDGETTFSSQIPEFLIPKEKTGDQVLREVIDSSVLKSYLLPYRTKLEEDNPLVLSGIGMFEKHQVDTKYLNWKNINRDTMDFELEKVTVEPEKNYPVKDGEIYEPDNFIDEIKEGFEGNYRVWMDIPEGLEDLLNESEGMETRFMMRGTRDYSTMRFTLTTPMYLKSGALAGVKVDGLLPSFKIKFPNYLDELYPVLEAEKEAMRNWDIPKFNTRTDSRDLYRGNEVVKEGFLGETGVNKLFSRIRGLSEDDLERQLDLITGSLAAKSEVSREVVYEKF